MASFTPAGRRYSRRFQAINTFTYICTLMETLSGANQQRLPQWLWETWGIKLWTFWWPDKNPFHPLRHMWRHILNQVLGIIVSSRSCPLEHPPHWENLTQTPVQFLLERVFGFLEYMRLCSFQWLVLTGLVTTLSTCDQMSLNQYLWILHKSDPWKLKSH